jgi:hypothetical protein
MAVLIYRFFIFLYHPNQTDLQDATKDPSICPTYTSMVLGDVLYALAYRANFLYLILIGRTVTGFGLTSNIAILKTESF